jgi:predicted nucleotidyltransferase
MKTWTPPTPAEVEEKIQEMVRRIVEGFDPERIILFGSRARGDAGPDSDVDLLVVMETESKHEAAVQILVTLDVMGIAKDVIVVTPEEFERRKEIVGSIAYPAHHEGRLLYERP